MRRLLLALALFPLPALAQPGWGTPPDAPSVSLDLAGGWAEIPLVTVGPTIVASRSLTYARATLAGRVPVADGLTAVAALPLAAIRGTTSGDPGMSSFRDDSGVALGNLYVGIASVLDEGFEVEGGIWLPTTTDSDFTEASDPEATYTSTSTGFAVDPEHLEAYYPKTAALRVAFSAEGALGESTVLRARLAPIASLNVGEKQRPSEPRSNVAFTGSVLLDQYAGPLRLTGGTVIRYEPPAGAIGYPDEGVYSALLGASVEVGAVRPRVQARIPFLGFSMTDATVGLGLDVSLR